MGIVALSLVRDLTLLVDKVDPDAWVTAQVITCVAGEQVTLTVYTDRVVDEAELKGPRVLRTANALVAGAQ